MRTCKWCGKSGWFLSLSKDGYCQSCEAEVKSKIIHATQVLNECMRLMNRARDLDLRLAKAKLAIQKLRELLPYYEKGLVQLKPSPQEWVTRIHSEERKMVNGHVSALLNDSIRIAKQSPNAAQRLQPFEKVEDAIKQYSDQLGRATISKWLARVETEKEYLIKDLENAANKTTDRDLALAQYRETLEMLKFDFSGSQEEVMEIRKIEKLITDLGGKLPEPPEKKPSQEEGTPTPRQMPQKKTGT